MALSTAETHTSYRCTSCGEEFRYSTDANDCCANTSETLMYVCGACGEEHSYEEDADKCCIDEVTVRIQCDDCSAGTTVNTKDPEKLKQAILDAQLCCVDSEEVTRYECNGCNATYDTESEAAACHANVEELTVYECPLCEFRSHDKSKAMFHCQSPD